MPAARQRMAVRSRCMLVPTEAIGGPGFLTGISFDHVEKVAKTNEIAVILCKAMVEKTPSSQKSRRQGLIAHRLREDKQPRLH